MSGKKNRRSAGDTPQGWGCLMVGKETGGDPARTRKIAPGGQILNNNTHITRQRGRGTKHMSSSLVKEGGGEGGNIALTRHGGKGGKKCGGDILENVLGRKLFRHSHWKKEKDKTIGVNQLAKTNSG